MAAAGGGVGVAVSSVLAVGVGILHCEKVGRGNELDLVVTRLQTGELVVALFNGSGTEVVAGDGAGNQHIAAVVQLNNHVVDAHLTGVLDAVGVGVEPHKIAELGTLQLHNQRLYVPRRVDDSGEKGIGGQHTVAAGDRVLRCCLHERDVSYIDDIAIVVVQETVQALAVDDCIGEPYQLPQGDLHLAKVVLPAILRVRCEVLRQQPVDLVDLSLCQRTESDGHVRRQGVTGGVLRQVGSWRQIDVDGRVKTVGVVDTVGNKRVGTASHDHVEEAGREKVRLLAISRTRNVGC